MSQQPDSRSAALWRWFLTQCPLQGLGSPTGQLEVVSGDASFRRYFRGHTGQGSWVLVDAPPDKEDSGAFIRVRQLLQQAGVRVPRLVASDLAAGFMCLEDFGDALLLPALQQSDLGRAAELYQRAFDELLLIQGCDTASAQLPVYDAERLHTEMGLFRDWLCGSLLAWDLSPGDSALLTETFAQLASAALAQPQVFVHRDYHSRNLMLLPERLGVIDFQDAVLGPITYDLVSLLKDCYIAWPLQQVEAWALDYLAQAEQQGLLPATDPERFLRDFHLMGAQRHLKAAGIFCRLCLRDGKAGYLQDIPRTLGYIVALAALPELQDFAGFLEQRVLPALEQRLEGLAASEAGK